MNINSLPNNKENCLFAFTILLYKPDQLSNRIFMIICWPLALIFLDYVIKIDREENEIKDRKPVHYYFSFLCGCCHFWFAFKKGQWRSKSEQERALRSQESIHREILKERSQEGYQRNWIKSQNVSRTCMLIRSVMD